MRNLLSQPKVNANEDVYKRQAQGGTINDNTMVFPIWWSGQAVAKDAGQPWEHSFRKNVIAEENL